MKFIYISILFFVLLSCNTNEFESESACPENTFQLEVIDKKFCSGNSEYGSVLCSKSNNGNELRFWYYFYGENKSGERIYEFSFISASILNKIGETIFIPKNNDNSYWTLDNAFLEVSYDYENILPWKNKKTDLTKLNFKIDELDEFHLSGTVEIFIGETKYIGKFKNLKIREYKNI